MNDSIVTRWDRGVDTFFLLSHLAIALLASLAFEAISHLHVGLRIGLVLVYVTVAFSLFRWLQRADREARRVARERELAAKEEEIASQRRYRLLESEMLRIVGEFVKDRYKANHDLATQLQQAASNERLTSDRVIEIVNDWDKGRRDHIKSALAQVSSFLVSDDFKKPRTADEEVNDHFKVSFYRVSVEPNGEEVLVPQWRYYPNEGEPRTKKFMKSDGAAGKAWQTKRIVVCENGGRDPHFKDMWDGGGQKEKYASMICVPAIEDIPAEKMSDVYGILTIDTPIRDGYFRAKQDQFWADLLQPLCNVLIYCRELERTKESVTLIARKLSALDSP